MSSAADVRPTRSIRTELIVYNIMALALLMLVLGVIIRYTVLSTIIASVDRELYGRTHRFDGGGGPPQGPPFNPGEDGPGGPPGDRRGQQDGQPQRRSGTEPAGQTNPAEPQKRSGSMGPDEQSGLHMDERSRRPDPAQIPSQFDPRRGWFRRTGPPPRRRRRPEDDNPYSPRLFDANGKSFGPTSTTKLWDADGLTQAMKGRTVYATVMVNGEPIRVLSRPFPNFGPVEGVIQAPYPLTEVYRAIASLSRALLLLSPLGLVGAGLGGAYLTDRVLRRVRRMTQAAGQISAKDFSARLPVSGDDEFAELASTFNGLLTRLEGAFRQQARLFEQQQRFTADASHELKTPLTVIKGTASMALSAPSSEALYRESFVEIDRAASTMSHLVQDLLLLARSDGGQMGRNPIEVLLSEILRQAVSRAARVPVAQGTIPANVKLVLEEESLTVRGNEEELVRLFGNLIDNAVRWTPTEGTITVTARRDGAARALVTVEDTGAGIAEPHLAHLGERFYRVDASRSRPDGGTGLGLSISKGIVEAHGGTIGFASVVGQGTTVRVALPTESP